MKSISRLLKQISR